MKKRFYRIMATFLICIISVCSTASVKVFAETAKFEKMPENQEGLQEAGIEDPKYTEPVTDKGEAEKPEDAESTVEESDKHLEIEFEEWEIEDGKKVRPENGESSETVIMPGEKLMRTFEIVNKGEPVWVRVRLEFSNKEMAKHIKLQVPEKYFVKKGEFWYGLEPLAKGERLVFSEAIIFGSKIDNVKGKDGEKIKDISFKRIAEAIDKETVKPDFTRAEPWKGKNPNDITEEGFGSDFIKAQEERDNKLSEVINKIFKDIRGIFNALNIKDDEGSGSSDSGKDDSGGGNSGSGDSGKDDSGGGNSGSGDSGKDDSGNGSSGSGDSESDDSESKGPDAEFTVDDGEPGPESDEEPGSEGGREPGPDDKQYIIYKDGEGSDVAAAVKRDDTGNIIYDYDDTEEIEDYDEDWEAEDYDESYDIEETDESNNIEEESSEYVYSDTENSTNDYNNEVVKTGDESEPVCLFLIIVSAGILLAYILKKISYAKMKGGNRNV